MHKLVAWFVSQLDILLTMHIIECLTCFLPTTLQESSFQPAGAANTLPSESYDFFAPLGEFGQPRLHYHQMRLTHHTIQTYASELASTVTQLPDVVPTGQNDTSTLRWAVRSNGTGGLIFVNNNARMLDMPAHNNVQFALGGAAGGLRNLTVPLVPFTVTANSWFSWPFRWSVADGLQLEYASAQVGIGFSATVDGALVYWIRRLVS